MYPPSNDLIEVVRAFTHRRASKKSVNNTCSLGNELLLHGNKIAFWDQVESKPVIKITTAGYNTRLTIGRLNLLSLVIENNSVTGSNRPYWIRKIRGQLIIDLRDKGKIIWNGADMAVYPIQG